MQASRYAAESDDSKSAAASPTTSRRTGSLSKPLPAVPSPAGLDALRLAGSPGPEIGPSDENTSKEDLLDAKPAEEAVTSVPQLNGHKEQSEDSPTAQSPQKPELPSDALAVPTPPAPATPINAQRVASPAPSAKNMKKVLSKRGKPCIIRVPGGDAYKRPGWMPLSAQEVRDRLAAFEREGLDVSGWKAGDSTVDTQHTQNRTEFPDPEEIRAERAENKKASPSAADSVVCIPDQKKWNAYVNELTEAKLRALGVSIGGEDEPAAAPPPAPARSIASPFSGLAKSPPVPTSSAASQSGWQNNVPFSAPFSPASITNNTSMSGFVSPPPSVPSVGSVGRPGHMSRQSTFNGQSSFGFQFPMAQPGQTILPGFVPQHALNAANVSSRSGSPGFPGAPQRMPSAFSFSSVSGDNPNDRLQTPKPPITQPLAKAQLSQSQNERPASVTQKEPQRPSTPEWRRKPADGAQDAARHNDDEYGELAYPTPRGHRHNISENLEREVEREEYYPGEFVNTADSKVFNFGNGTPMFAGHPFGQSLGHQSTASVASNASSGTKLNVAAKEFKFNPNTSHGRNFSVSKSALVPASVQAQVSFITAHSDGTSTGGGNFDARASAFKPSEQATDFPFSSGFEFSANRQLTPQRDGEEKAAEAAVESDNKPEEPSKPKIFGGISFSDFIKPAKQSKAIPIVNPNANRRSKAIPIVDPKDVKKSDDGEVGEDGRFGNQARVKRGRVGGADGDSVPQFATPTPEPEAAKLPPPAKILPSNEPIASKTTQAAVEEEASLIDMSDDPWHELDDQPVVKEDVKVDKSTPEVHVEKAVTKASEPAPEQVKETEQQVVETKPVKAEEVTEVEKKDSVKVTEDTVQKAISAAQSESAEKSQVMPKETEAAKVEQPVEKAIEKSSEKAIEEPTEQPAEKPAEKPTEKLAQKPFFFKAANESARESVKESVEKNVQQPAEIAPEAQKPQGFLVRDLDNDELIDFDEPQEDLSRKKSNEPRPVLAPLEPNKLSNLAKNLEQPTGGVSSEWLRDQRSLRTSESPVRKLNVVANPAISDWDDMLESGDETKFFEQTTFFDNNRARNMIDDALRQHLEPLFKSLRDVDLSVKRVATRTESEHRLMSSHDKSSSDADDEDDDDDNSEPARPRSRKADRKRLDIKMAVTDAIKSWESGSIAQQLESALARERDSIQRAENLEKRLLLSEREISLYKESSEDLETKVQGLEEEKRLKGPLMSSLIEENDQLKRDYEVLKLDHQQSKAKHEESRTKLEELEEERAHKTTLMASLTKESDLHKRNFDQTQTKWEQAQSKLEEYRASSERWRKEVDQIRHSREQINQTVASLHKEAEEREREHDSVKRKLDELQNSLAQTTSTLVGERQSSQKKEEDQSREIMVLGVRLEEQLRSHSKLEKDMQRMANQEREAIRSTVMLEETQRSNNRLLAEMEKMRVEIRRQQDRAAHFEREANDSGDYLKAQIKRTETLLGADVEIAKKRVENIRADLETRLAMERKDHESTKKSANEDRLRLQKALEDAHTSRRDAMRDAADTHNAIVKEERGRFELSVNTLSTEHERALQLAYDAKQRSETHLNETLKVANEKIALMQDKIDHLEDKVSVAQSAAHAAAAAAKETAKAAPTSLIPPSERVSPQALRESIVVLQEQLQEREGRIESLESELNAVDKDLPRKLTERETEVGWLRELLGVRIDDLSELVNTLSLENFDRATARDAAIRIRANLQMEQQMKERLIGRGSSSQSQLTGPQLPSLADIQNFASPRAAQIASAWTSWRKGGPNPMAGLRETMMQRASSAGFNLGPGGVAEATPSKGSGSAAPPPSAQSFLSGLMTPPASNVRRTPTPGQASAGASKDSPPAAERDVSPSPLKDREHERSPTPEPRQTTEPSTPTLLGEGSYDEDAAAGAYDDDLSDDEEPDTETIRETGLAPLGEELSQVEEAESVEG